MQTSTNKILTTHTGSLPRPEDLQHLLEAQDRGEQIDRVAFEARLREAVKEVVQRQASCGIDVINDGEMSKISYSTYVKDRLTGFDDRTALSPSLRLDLPEFPGFAKRMGAVLLDYARPACTVRLATGARLMSSEILPISKLPLQGQMSPKCL